jgi:uncharacterized damage-inducible protein DinB
MMCCKESPSMDLLDRLLGHDAATTRQLLLLSRDLSDEELDRPFDIGHRTLRATFRHIIGNMEVWTDLMRERPARTAQPAGADSVAALLARLDAVAPDFAALAAQIRDEGRWDDLWTDVLDDPPQQKTYGGAIGHLLTHSMGHRGEVLHILARLGVPDLPEGDLLGWEMARRRGGG